MRRAATILLTALTPLALAATAQAETVELTGPGDFSGGETMLTFDDLGLSNGSPIESVAGVGFELGPDTPAAYYGDPFPREFGPADIGAVANFLGQSMPFPDLSLHLPDLMTRIGFEARVNAADDLRVLLLRAGEVVDEVTVPSRGSDQLYFYGYENTAGFDEVLVDAVDFGSGAFTLDNLAFESIGLAPEGPGEMAVYTCEGFASPWSAFLDRHPRHRALWKIFIARLPVRVLQARLVAEDGTPLADADLAAPPVVQVMFASRKGGDPQDVTSHVLGDFPEAFRFDADKGLWQLLLPKRRMHGWGTYVVTVESADPASYDLSPTCTKWVSHRPSWWHFLFGHRRW